MKSFTYHPFAETLTLHFVCPKCGEEIDTDALDVPRPNMIADCAADSENCDDFDIWCPNCDWSSQVTLYTRYDGGYGEVEQLDEDVDLRVEEELSE